jgi:hypothetical protein
VSKFIDIAGQRFGLLTALRPCGQTKQGRGDFIWECRCDCGTLVPMRGTRLRSGEVKNCRRGNACPATFWSRIDKNGPMPSAIAVERYPEIDGTRCWPWTGCTNSNGYGVTSVNSIGRLSHRIAWFFTFGSWPTPNGLHKCDYPPCCNPDHLFEGTQEDNTRDAARKGRTSRGSKNHNAQLYTNQILEIRERLASGESAKALASAYSVSVSIIGDIKRGETWKHAMGGY